MKKEKKELKVSDLNDIFVYKVDKNYIYCAPFSKTGYILSNKEAKPFSVYSTRYYLPLSIAILAFLISKSIIISIIALVGLFIIMELMFRKNVLANCPVIENFERPTKNSIFEKAANKFQHNELFVPLVLLIVLAIAIPINAKSNNYEGAVLIGNYVVAGLAFALAIFILMCIIYIKNHKKK
ncbi:MAG: hypothetical protein Q4E33_03465 [Erysipelotrichaceae bacterium]|nr:hypothetical protein [Erysipelotrichaceae bacterium]